MLLQGVLRGQYFEAITNFRFLGNVWEDRSFLGVLALTSDFCKSISIFSNLRGGGFRLLIQRTIPIKVAMFMEFPATKGNMLVVYCLNPLKVIMK